MVSEGAPGPPGAGVRRCVPGVRAIGAAVRRRWGAGAVTTVEHGASGEGRHVAADLGEDRASTALGRHYEGLDGLRAVAVILILLYHGEVSWARGGFLGVTLFFTLSGFLITGVLLRNPVVGGAGLRSFWSRRARRLMPAAFIALAGVVLFGATVAVRPQADALPGDVFAAATWTANWHFILSGTSYLDLFSAPSPAQHFWSLAIEEQAYLLLPIGLLLLARRRCSPLLVAALLGAAAVASTVWMTVLSHGGAGLDRLYYGTDTRIGELLIGGALAAVLAWTGRDFPRTVRRLLAAFGCVGLAALLWWAATASLVDVALYRGGFLAFSLLTCAAILAILADVGPVRRVLSAWPLPPIGRISYGLYLYHWPIYLWLTASRTGLSGWSLLALRVGVTFAVAIASYRYVEQPIIHGALARFPRWIRWTLAPLAAVTVVAAGVVFVNRSAADPFAALRQNPASAAAARADDGVLDLLVIPRSQDDPLLGAAAGRGGAQRHPPAGRSAVPLHRPLGGNRARAHVLELGTRVAHDRAARRPGRRSRARGPVGRHEPGGPRSGRGDPRHRDDHRGARSRVRSPRRPWGALRVGRPPGGDWRRIRLLQAVPSGDAPTAGGALRRRRHERAAEHSRARARGVRPAGGHHDAGRRRAAPATRARGPPEGARRRRLAGALARLRPRPLGCRAPAGHRVEPRRGGMRRRHGRRASDVRHRRPASPVSCRRRAPGHTCSRASDRISSSC